MLKNSIKVAVLIAFFAVAGFIFLQNRSVADTNVQTVLNSKNIYGFDIQEQIGKSEFLIINFWASWCPPCIQEIPSLLKFIQIHHEYKIIAVSQDDGISEIKNIIKTFPDLKNKNFEIIFDQSKALSRLFKVDKLPETFIYQYSSKKMMKISGSIDWISPETKNQIDQYFKKTN